MSQQEFVVFSLNQEGATFKVKVIDIVEGVAFDPALFESQRIVFYKPDGTRFEEDAMLVVDTENPTESFVIYQNTGEPSILDLRGHWQYSAEITFTSGDTAETANRFNFWVQ